MKQAYIKKVKRVLICSAKQKKVLLRDLEEIFSSAAEHGESEAEVITRLGTAKEYAKATGVAAKVFHFLFIVMVALVIAASMRIVGVLLVSSLMTLPVAASIRLAKGFKQAIILSIIFGEASVLGGLFLAYYLDLAPGGTIVMIAVLILAVTVLWKKISVGRLGRG